MLTTASNASANTAIRYLKTNAANASNAMGKLSSGSRIVKASDDAASLAVGTKIKADVTTLKMAQTNSSHAQSLLQVADGGMARIGDMLQRMKALATQANSGSVSNAERGFIAQVHLRGGACVGESRARIEPADHRRFLAAGAAGKR